MKNTLSLLLGMLLIYSCSTTNDTQLPAPPENLIVETTSNTTIKLMWTDRSTNETGFKIERKLVGGTFAVVGKTDKDVTIFSDTNLTRSTTYIYRVFSYNTGGNSTVYSNELMLTTNSSIPTITNGTQVWTDKNLDVATYSDGTTIPQVTDPTAWSNLTTGAWCYYENNMTIGETFGKLYNWYAVVGIWNESSKTNTSLRKKLAPNGWHIPSDSEWTILTTYLEGENVAGGKMKESGITHWKTPNKDATNSSNFTGLPGSQRNASGSFSGLGYTGFWWSSSETDISGAWSRNLDCSFGNIYRQNNSKEFGFSVRCIRD